MIRRVRPRLEDPAHAIGLAHGGCLGQVQPQAARKQRLDNVGPSVVLRKQDGTAPVRKRGRGQRRLRADEARDAFMVERRDRVDHGRDGLDSLWQSGKACGDLCCCGINRRVGKVLHPDVQPFDLGQGRHHLAHEHLPLAAFDAEHRQALLQLVRMLAQMRLEAVQPEADGGPGLRFPVWRRQGKVCIAQSGEFGLHALVQSGEPRPTLCPLRCRQNLHRFAGQFGHFFVAQEPWRRIADRVEDGGEKVALYLMHVRQDDGCRPLALRRRGGELLGVKGKQQRLEVAKGGMMLGDRILGRRERRTGLLARRVQVDCQLAQLQRRMQQGVSHIRVGRIGLVAPGRIVEDGLVDLKGRRSKPADGGYKRTE